MIPNDLSGARMPNALDHGCMIARIAQNDTIFKPAAQRAQSCPIGHVARGEQQSRFFIVQICQFPLKQQVIMICP